MSDGAISGELMPQRPGITVEGQPEKTAGLGVGAYEGADRIGREMASWKPRIVSPDAAIMREKGTMDARGNDLIRNNGQIYGAQQTSKDSIIGSQYRLNLSPVYTVLRRMNPGMAFDEVWAEEFQEEVEELFHLYAESEDRYIDVQRRWTFTGLLRMMVGVYFAGGEMLATCNWMTNRASPYATSFQLVDCDRLSNPQDMADTKAMRRGVELDANGAPIAVHIRRGYPTDTERSDPGDNYTWDRRSIWLKWGRLNTLLIQNLQRPEQNRGVADLVAVLKETRMADRFHGVTLANAIANASFAASIESELPPDMAFEMIGAKTGTQSATAGMAYLQAIAEYARGGRNIEIDGVKIPHLFPGTKLKMYPAGTVGGIGTGFETALHRYMSAGLGISYEELTNDFSKTNYSSARAAANNTLRFMTARKKEIADRAANCMFRNWFEEAMDEGHFTTLNPFLKRNKDLFYEGMNKDALCNATWIGASRYQVDELKETQSAVMRINAGLGTAEGENARLGLDWRQTYRQQAREKRMREKLGLDFTADARKPGTLSSTKNDTQDQQENDDEDDGFGD